MVWNCFSKWILLKNNKTENSLWDHVITRLRILLTQFLVPKNFVKSTFSLINHSHHMQLILASRGAFSTYCLPCKIFRESSLQINDLEMRWFHVIFGKFRTFYIRSDTAFGHIKRVGRRKRNNLAVFRPCESKAYHMVKLCPNFFH